MIVTMIPISPVATAALLASPEGKALPLESRLLAILAVDAKSAALGLAQLMPELKRPLVDEEIRILTEAKGLQDRGHRVALACPREARIHDEALKRGIETVALRMERHCENSLAVAKHLQAHRAVDWVRFPALPSDPQFAANKKYLRGKGGSMVVFGIKGGREAGKKFIDALKLFSHLANVGDAKSLAIHPATTTHSQLSAEQQLAGGIKPELIRLSIGIEDFADIKADLEIETLLVDEPFGRDSTQSQMLQLCDLLAYLTKQQLEPNALFRRPHAQRILARCERLFQQRGATIRAHEEGGACAPPFILSARAGLRPD